MTFQRVLAISKGTKIGKFTVMGPGISRGEPELLYKIPNNCGGKPSLRRIRQSEWKSAYRYFRKHGTFTELAFHKTMPYAARNAPNGFAFVMGIFQLLGLGGEAHARFVPELLPKPLWGRSASTMFGQRMIWTKQIRPNALALANYCCELCGAKGPRLDCYDKWLYDDTNASVTLIGFEIHCPECDAVTNLGRAVDDRGNPEEVCLAVLAHLCRVNQSTLEAARDLLMTALEKWLVRNEKSWQIVVSTSLIQRYPELAQLPNFIPTPQTGAAVEKGTAGSSLRSGRT
jgi:hypothetical protein